VTTWGEYQVGTEGLGSSRPAGQRRWILRRCYALAVSDLWCTRLEKGNCRRDISAPYPAPFVRSKWLKLTICVSQPILLRNLKTANVNICLGQCESLSSLRWTQKISSRTFLGTISFIDWRKVNVEHQLLVITRLTFRVSFRGVSELYEKIYDCYTHFYSNLELFYGVPRTILPLCLELLLRYCARYSERFGRKVLSEHMRSF